MPLHRSILFWLGLFVLSFLLWAWADSRQNYTQWYPRSTTLDSLGFGHAAGALHVSRASVVPPPAASGSHVTVLPLQKALVRLPLYRGRQIHVPWFAAPRWESGFKSGGGPSFMSLGRGTASVPLYMVPDVQQTTLILPHWVILLFYLPAWGFLSVWRALKIARRDEALANPELPGEEV